MLLYRTSFVVIKLMREVRNDDKYSVGRYKLVERMLLSNYAYYEREGCHRSAEYSVLMLTKFTL